jgi:hypothetical protein
MPSAPGQQLAARANQRCRRKQRICRHKQKPLTGVRGFLQSVAELR